MTTEHEPVFDAAEFTRLGRDIFCQRQVARFHVGKGLVAEIDHISTQRIF